MAPLHAITLLGLAASVLALPGYGTHVSHGTSVIPTGSVRSHHLPSGTQVSSGIRSHSNHSESRKSSATTEVTSSIDAIPTSAVYVAQQAAGSDCGTITTRIQVTVTVTAGEASSTVEAPTVIAQPVISSVVSSASVAHSHHHHSGSSEGAKISSASSSSATSTSLAAVATSSSSSATYTVPSSSSTAETYSSADVADKVHNPFTSVSAISWPSVATTAAIIPTTTPVVVVPTTTPVVVLPTTTASAIATTAASSSSSSSMPKRGLAYNDASLVTDFASSSKIGWAYNWGSSSGGLPSNIKYIPTLWSNTSTFTNSWVSNANAAIKAGTDHIFSFNEPDMTSQSNLSPEAAADAYKTWIHDEFSSNSNVKLCAPSVTNGADSQKNMGLDWLASFLTLAKAQGSRVDCINIHWYGTEASDLESHVSQAIAQATAAGISDVWLTEFGLNGSPSASTISTFLESAIPALESTSLSGYAYFMLSDSILVSGNALNAAGQTYMTTS